MDAYRSPLARRIAQTTRKVKSKSPPPLNLSYVNKRNTSGEGRRRLNQMVLESMISRNTPLTNNQMVARRNATLKMARGNTPSNAEKLAAGILSKNNYNTRKYNATLNRVTKKIRNYKRSREGAKGMSKPPFTREEGNILGATVIRNLYNTA